MTDTDSYIQRLEESNPLREPVLREAIQSLHLPSGSYGLDVGCGIGLQTILLSKAVGPGGHITGLDLAPALLSYAGMLVERAGVAEQISFRTGDMCNLPFEDRSFDWAWSADCVGYPVGDLLPLLKELARVVRPGGSVAILAWSGQQLLPGYPLLEARLNATCSALAPFVKESRPESHFLRALGWFRAAGLVGPKGHTIVGDVQAPLGDAVRRALISLFAMLWGVPEPEVAPGDWLEYQRLCQPESPDCILNLPDYYAFFSYSMFHATVPG